VQKVTLVFCRVGALQEGTLSVDDGGSGIVSRCQQIAAETLRVVPKNPKLDFAITQDIWIRGSSGTVLSEKILEYLVPVLSGKICMVQGYTELLAHISSILEIIGGCAVTVVVLPVGHVQGVHLGAGPLQQNRCDS
jgi:hypothetical protein